MRLWTVHSLSQYSFAGWGHGAINERQLSHPGLDNPVWDQAVTSGWRAAPAQPSPSCDAAPLTLSAPQSVGEKTSLAPPQLHMRFTENNTTADPGDEVSALNCDFCCFLLWAIWLEVRREKGSAQQHRVGGRKMMPSSIRSGGTEARLSDDGHPQTTVSC